MKNFYFLLLIIVVTTTGKTQTFEWLKTAEINYEFNPGMIQYTTCTDSEGNIYFFGLKEFLITYNQAMGHQFLNKYNPEGELIWEKTITGEALASGIYSDNAGGVYLYGQMLNDISFGEELTLYHEGIGTNSFLIKMNYDGEIDWGINLEDLPVESGTIADITTDNEEMLFVAYFTWINSHIFKINSDGDYLGAIIQENVSLVSGVDVDADGNIYAAGGCAGMNSTFGGVSHPAPFSYSTYIVKYNSIGEPEWVKFIEDVTCTYIKVQCDNSGGIYAAGQLFAESALDTIVVHGAEWVYDFFLTRLNADGEFQWALECPQVLTGDATVGQLQFLSSDADGNALLAGFTRGMIDWGNGIITNIGDFYYNVMIWNVNPYGMINWVKTAGGEGYDDSHSICTGPDGDIYLAGITGGTTVFDTITHVSDDFVYPFLAKLDMPSITNINYPEVRPSTILYPNPASEKIYIMADGADTYYIFNNLGAKMKEGRFTDPLQQVDVDDLDSGIYFILLKEDLTSTTRTSKFMVK
jgi:hypothetical protein